MDDEWIYGGRLQQIHQTIVEGRPNGMPAWGGRIPDPQIWQIAAYVRSMSLPQTLAAQTGPTPSQSPAPVRSLPPTRTMVGRPLPETTNDYTTTTSGTRLRQAVAAVLALGLCALTSAKATQTLTVCADPNNLPFSNQAGEGFENKIIGFIARELHRPLRYVWWAQRRGYVRNTLNESKCDIRPGVAQGVERLATTRPYYRSSYVFVVRADSHLVDLNLDDPRLRSLSLGVQMVGSDANNTPPAHAIASRGIIENVAWLHAVRELRPAQSRRQHHQRRRAPGGASRHGVGTPRWLFRASLVSPAVGLSGDDHRGRRLAHGLRHLHGSTGRERDAVAASGYGAESAAICH